MEYIDSVAVAGGLEARVPEDRQQPSLGDGKSNAESRPFKETRDRAIADGIHNYIKKLIRTWIARNISRQRQVAISLTSLLEYFNLQPSVIDHTVAKCMRKGNSYSLSRKSDGPGRKRYVFVSLGCAVDIIRDQLPSVSRLLVDVLEEERTSAVRH